MTAQLILLLTVFPFSILLPVEVAVTGLEVWEAWLHQSTAANVQHPRWLTSDVDYLKTCWQPKHPKASKSLIKYDDNMIKSYQIKKEIWSSTGYPLAALAPCCQGGMATMRSSGPSSFRRFESCWRRSRSKSPSTLRSWTWNFNVDKGDESASF